MISYSCPGSGQRRRAGPGETFWQFRHYDQNDSVTGIDWRRSASSDNLFVREREWEAAHTVWLWVDLSPSMRFRSSLTKSSKESRAVVLALAMTELLSRGGERIGDGDAPDPLMALLEGERAKEGAAPVRPPESPAPPFSGLRPVVHGLVVATTSMSAT